MNVFLDDVREPPMGWDVARSMAECVELLKANEVEQLSLDHDLGEGLPTGLDMVDWLVANDVWPPVITVHTANPVGRQRMIATLQRYAPVHVRLIHVFNLK